MNTDELLDVLEKDYGRYEQLVKNENIAIGFKTRLYSVQAAIGSAMMPLLGKKMDELEKKANGR